ncbi:MAG: acyltransferase family protein [Thermoleophilaceae bacterium]|nr:acyltransferase family protein [Thermoleophilaceae bacterium]
MPRSRARSLLNQVLDAANSVTQPVLLDAENVPRSGPVMLVGNHTLLGVQDVPSMVRELERQRGVTLRPLGDRFHFAVPGWGELLTRLGAVCGTRENCAELLAAGEAVVVFPGGAREVFKRKDQKYELLWGERTGFARMAIQASCPIVPFGAVGAEDSFKVVLDVDDALGWPVRQVARKVGREDFATAMLRGSGPAMLPSPERLYFRFGTPIDTSTWAGLHEEAAARDECRDHVRSEVQAQVDFLLAYREDDPDRGFVRRAASALRKSI